MEENRRTNPNRASHARRTPGEVTRRTGAVPSKSGTGSTPYRTQRNNGSLHAVTTVGRQRAATPLRTYPTEKETALVARKEAKQVREARAERAWQKDIVRVRGGVDIPMLVIILLLLALGTITVFSASYPYAIAKGYDSNYFILNQLKFLLIGGVAMTGMALLPTRLYRSWAPIASMIVSIGLLIAVMFIGTSEGQAVRWIRFGSFGIQPSEIMKVALILMLAWYYQRRSDRINDMSYGFLVAWKWNTAFPLAILAVACFFILIGKHLSGTIITGAIGIAMILAAGSNVKWIAATGAPVGVLAVGGYLLLNPYALKRITTKLNENADKLDELYQTTQSLYAIGNGGLFGVGLGQSVQKYSYLSAAHTDFIFAVWCEEWGFVGAVFLILLYLAFVWRGYVIAVRAPDRFTMLTAFGITTQVGLQAMLNMCVAADIIPNTGISLPFFSYGGSSLVVLMAEMGILLSISRQSYKKKSEIEREQMMKKIGLEKG